MTRNRWFPYHLLAHHLPWLESSQLVANLIPWARPRAGLGNKLCSWYYICHTAVECIWVVESVGWRKMSLFLGASLCVSIRCWWASLTGFAMGRQFEFWGKVLLHEKKCKCLFDIVIKILTLNGLREFFLRNCSPDACEAPIYIDRVSIRQHFLPQSILLYSSDSQVMYVITLTCDHILR